MDTTEPARRSREYCLHVRGDFACFTRPEMKVERMSYDVITPSAARAIFEAILWKPALRWRILRIEVLNEIAWMSLRRNEVANVIPMRNVQSAMKAGTGNLGLYIEDDRQQRAGLFLRDVAYRLHAQFTLQPDCGENNSVEKFHEMFVRRAQKGQCVNQPYLGCREFACDFRLVDNPASEAPALDKTQDLGWMLYDMDFGKGEIAKPHFFHAKLQNGVLDVSGIGSAK
ncbi:type I-C CRISPR-associated protein Cas5c [Massilia sp. W12]|uniref:type I-C CRISPR-associated protein Cas5c n=1 Tax=Massilia sp. W12 TaxID=3126507 RepID=UPI0030D01C43